MRDKVFNIAKHSKYGRYQRGLASMAYKFFDKKASGSGIKNENILNKELAVELHKFTEKKVLSPFIDNIWLKILGFYYVLLIFTANMLGSFL